MTTYKTLPDLVNALHAHKIPRDKLHVTIDNDSISGYLVHDKDWDDVDKVFEIDPSDLTEQVFTFLGIPWEYV